jgi:uncharacterized protein (TIGR00369 family)
VRRSTTLESGSIDLGALRDLVPFAAQLGIELLEATPEVVRARVEWAHERTTTADLLHGGVIMALADTCGAIAAFMNLPEGATGTATIESKTNFLRAVRSGSIVATTRPLYLGRTLAVLETEVARDDGKLAAKVTQTQIYHHPRAGE